MIRCVIIDDERNCREDLQSLIGHHFRNRLEIVGLCESVAEGVLRINATLPEIVFLDISMPHEDGFKLFEKFDDINFEVVFTTAYAEFAINAIKHAAFDYLVKPIDPKAIEQVLDRFEKKTSRKSLNQRVRLLLAQLQQGPDPSVLVSLPVNKEFKVVNAREITYCQADVNYTKIFLSDGTIVHVTKTLGKVEEILDYPFFFRCHKSFLVNLNFIDKYNKVDKYIKLKSGVTVYLADRRVEDFINVFRSRD